MDLRERIINEAGTLFARYGIRSITMDALAEDMGISKRTIYEQFKDKNTLLMEVIYFFRNQQFETAESIIKNSENIVVAMFRLFNNMVQNMKQVNPIFFHDMKKYHSNVYARIQQKGDVRDHTITRKILTLGVEQGIFNKELNTEILNLTLHELFNLFSPDSRMTQQGFDRGELFENIIIPFLKGIATDKGRKLIEKEGKIKY